MRDHLNTLENYQTLIAKKTAFIQEDLAEYSENNDWSEDQVVSHFSRTFMYSYQVLIAKYSLGLEISELLPDYRQSISLMEKGWEAESGYVEMVWMLSIGIMLDIEEASFNKLAELIRKDPIADFLIHFLITARKPDWEFQPAAFRFPKPYQALGEVIQLASADHEKAIERLKQYLQKAWYPGHADTGWHSNHKSKWGVHFGYWSFESGALVKLLELNDYALKETKYYPYDMVHFKSPGHDKRQ